MTYLDVYVAELADGSDPLDWPGSTWSGNSAKGITECFPPASGYGQPFFRLRENIERGEYKGKQIDWGAWAAILTKQQILTFIDDNYRGNEWYTNPTKAPDLYEKLQAIVECVRSLPDGKSYALIAEEL